MKVAVVITLSKNLVHYCKALVASIKYFNSELPIIIIKDGSFSIPEFRGVENIFIEDSKDFNKLHNLDLYILLSKLNILYLPEMGYDYDYYVHLDADSILTNKIDLFSNEIYDFYILQGALKNYNEGNTKKFINQYAFNPDDFPEYQFDLKNFYFFSASHIALHKRIFPILKEYLIKHRFELNKIFLNDKRIRFNDQGFLNLITNVLSFNKELKIKVNNCGIYGKETPENYPLLNLNNIINKVNTEVLFIHYTGPSRKLSLRDHNYGDILVYFSIMFYKNNILSYYLSELKRKYNYYLKKIINKINFLVKKYK
ncbi:MULTISPECIES: hypothetical protein [Flavobacteriaceae]|uniref:Glycosyltransferase family 8 protein n=2 Tax=Flavobacteriaceae TaxID=49546 RepID=A0A4Y8AVS1_9FLAO|nr:MULTISPECIES: hypothetical protein [Flavobacteriaceae]TEW76579.1 hypothetical protein E2488_01640 [Gramella jeungdoensis]GGK60807.1 hypothetical protein GCM10007963_31070 [Lutibacter litoralis]